MRYFPAAVHKHPVIHGPASKFMDWQIREPQGTTETLILRDYNVTRITHKPSPDIEIQAFSGPKSPHMVAMLNKRQKQAADYHIRKVLLSVGTHDALTSTPIQIIASPTRRKATLLREKFPFARVSLAEIPTSHSTTPHQAARMAELNHTFRQLRDIQIVPCPPRHRVVLHPEDKIGIRWSPDSVNLILDLWYQSLN